ncbi:metallophosphoesterase family protein [Galbitalea sp. SE-J8]|uniref:metallophosphoesterase n=1 Tax=Galbitalea sp. SE-J8 TaxID=3054952 RepID=UPI00259C9930|nr:metallophosphoesterase [Galbitalea sp. SE-J8]MDM4763591.1 metallophosphoesterase family protein [Galbitalea sp. SE-J8]
MGAATRRALGAGLGVVGGLAGVAALWGTVIERNLFGVRHERLAVLPPGAASMRVLHLSDIHLAPWQRHKIDWIRSLAELEPDLVVNTGDNLGHAEANTALEHALAPFAGMAGVYVDGSNDHFGPVAKSPFSYFGGPSVKPKPDPDLDTARLHDYFESILGWTSLNNQAATTSIAGSRVELFGTSDAHRGWDRLDVLPRVVDDMREHVADLDDGVPVALTIGVTHAPYRRVLDAFVTQGADVVFAGHTHGGQVRIPFRPALVTNCDIPRGQASGLSLWHHAGRTAYLEVSAGIGNSIYAPVRFATPPEAVLVELTSVDIGYP